MKRNLSCILLASILLMSLSSCGNAELETETQTDTRPVETETSSPYIDDIPSDLNYEGQEIKVMTWLETKCYAEEQTGEVVNDAKFNRDLSVESRLNVDIVNIGESYTWDTKDLYIGKIRNSVIANDGAYDIASGQYATIPGLIADGVFMDMNTLPFLDFSKPYWAQDLVEETSIAGKLYLATGDITPATIDSIWCIFYNDTMRIDLGLEDPIALVKEGKWTKDVMNTMLSGIYQDTDGSQSKSANDTFGLVMLSDNCTYPFINAFELKITTMDENNYPVLTFNTEKVINAFEYMYNWLHVSQDVIFGQLGGELANPTNCFPEGRALFNVYQFKFAAEYIETMEDTFGVLPFPKYDEMQEEYRTWLGETNSLFGVVTTTSDQEAAAAVMEMLASESYRLVSPAIFETTLKTRYSVDSEMSQMFDLIREGVTFNFGLTYGFALNELNVFWKNQLSMSKNTFSSSWAAREAGWKQAIDNFYDMIVNMDE